MFRPKIGENGPKLAQNHTFSDFSQIWLITFSCFPGYSQRLIVALFCRKPHVQKKIWSRVTGPKRGKNGELVPRISRQRIKQIKICFDFWKARRFIFRKGLYQIFDISTPSPRKSRPKIGSDSGPKTRFVSYLEFASSDFSYFLHAVRG